jgi:hypothetical protein
MKTAEDWIIPLGTKHEKEWIALVKKIQLDAMKEGMLKAASLVRKYLDDGEGWLNFREQQVHGNIITAAEYLELK